LKSGLVEIFAKCDVTNRAQLYFGIVEAVLDTCYSAALHWRCNMNVFDMNFRISGSYVLSF